jgi:hypothetical protein
MKKHTNLWNELDIEQPKDYSNLAIGIAIGVLITLCGLVFAWTLLVERVMY